METLLEAPTPAVLAAPPTTWAANVLSSFAARPRPEREEDLQSLGPLHNEMNEDEDENAELTPAREAIYFLRNSVDSNIPRVTLHTMSDRYIGR